MKALLPLHPVKRAPQKHPASPMKIFFLNLKKCSTCKAPAVWVLALALAQLLMSTPLAMAKPHSFAGQKIDFEKLSLQPRYRNILSAMRRDLIEHQQPSFARMIRLWEQRFGVEAVIPLLAISQQQSLKDHHRYIAIMAAAKMGGAEVAPQIAYFLADSSWMVRNAAIRALSALKHPDAGTALLPLAEDKALVVRNEAIRALTRLQPQGTREILVQAALAENNFHGGKAQWVPITALAGLRQLGGPRNLIQQLRPLLDYEKDPKLLQATVTTLESLGQTKMGKWGDLHSQVSAWKKAIDEKQF